MANWTFDGSASEALKWLPLAKTYLASLRTPSMFVCPEEGVEIQIYQHGYIHIIAGGNYYFNLTTDKYRTVWVDGATDDKDYYTVGSLFLADGTRFGFLAKWSLSGLSLSKRIAMQIGTITFTSLQNFIYDVPHLTAIDVHEQDGNSYTLVAGSSNRSVEYDNAQPERPPRGLAGLLMSFDSNLKLLKSIKFFVAEPEDANNWVTIGQVFAARIYAYIIKVSDVIKIEDRYYIIGRLDIYQYNHALGFLITLDETLTIIEEKTTDSVIIPQVNGFFSGMDEFTHNEEHLFIWGENILHDYTIEGGENDSYAFSHKDDIGVGLNRIVLRDFAIKGNALYCVCFHRNPKASRIEYRIIVLKIINGAIQEQKLLTSYKLSGNSYLHLGYKALSIEVSDKDEIFVSGSFNPTKETSIADMDKSHFRKRNAFIAEFDLDLNKINHNVFFSKGGKDTAFEDIKISGEYLLGCGEDFSNHGYGTVFTNSVIKVDSTGFVTKWKKDLKGSGKINNTTPSTEVFVQDDVNMTFQDTDIVVMQPIGNELTVTNYIQQETVDIPIFEGDSFLLPTAKGGAF